MKILHYVDENRLAWGETWIQLIKELARQGVENHVVCKSGGTLFGRLGEEGISFDTCDLPVACLPWSAPKFGRIIDAFKPDIIHTRLSSAARVGGWWGRRKGIPVVETVDKHAKIKYYREASFLLPCSSSVLTHMENQGFPRDKMQVVYNPIDGEHYKRDISVRKNFRLQNGVDNETTIIVAGGRFDDGKGFEDLIEAYASILRKGTIRTKTRLWLLGDGPHKNRYLELIKRLGIVDKVLMPGFVSDVRPWFWASDVFVMPTSGHEGFGVILLEAMASSLALVATKSGGPMEIITDGVSGKLVEPKAVGQMAAVLSELINYPELLHSIAEKSLERSADFNLKIIAPQIVKVYNEFR